MQIFVKLAKNPVTELDGHLQNIEKCLLLLREARG
jgi:hypothetical protein